MLKIATVTIVLALSASAAFASCPRGTSYQCTPSWNGKMQCGCR